MYENICTLPLTADLFTQSLHPTQPLLAVGLSTGHVQCFHLPPADTDDAASEAAEKGYGEIETVWRTRRHKGSCRSLNFSLDGEVLYSAGTDGIVKVAGVEDGRVRAKLAVPMDAEMGEIDAPTLLHVLNPQSFLLATDSGALHLYDLRSDHIFKSSKPSATHQPHDDYISSITALPPTAASTSGFPKQFVSTGGTTLAVTDIRRGVLHQSEDQEEELLCAAIVTGLGKKGTSTGEKVLVGGASGVVTLWERGVWDDQDERIVLDRSPGVGESVDCLVNVPGEKSVVAGMGNGLLALVKVGSNQIFDVLRHDEVEGVVGLGFDASGRMISGGGQTVKVWREGMEVDDEGEEEEAEGNGSGKRKVDSDSEEDSEDSESEEEEKPKRKKRKGKGKGVHGVKNGVSMFKGLD